MKEVCPECGKEFQVISQHWRHNESHCPEFTGEQLDILRGVLLGDGSIGKPNATNPMISVGNTNIQFLEHLSEIMGILSTAIRVNKEPEGNSSPFYSVKTKHHPQLENVYERWIDETGKHIPTNQISFNKEVMKYWYACDGGLSWRKNGSGNWYADASIHVVTEINQVEDISRQISNDLEPNVYKNNGESRISYVSSEADKFLEWLGEPIPGMDYKWETDSRERYNSLKEQKTEYNYEQLSNYRNT